MDLKKSEVMRQRRKLFNELELCDERLADASGRSASYRTSTVFRIILKQREELVDRLREVGYHAQPFPLAEAV